MWCLQGRGKQTPSSPGAESMGGSASNKMHNAAHESSSRLFAACVRTTQRERSSTVANKKPKGVWLNSQLCFSFLGTVCVCGRVCGHRVQTSAPASPHTSAETVIFTSPLSVPRQKGRLSLQLPHPWELIQLEPSPRR